MSLNVHSMGLPEEIAEEVLRLEATCDFHKLSEKGANGYLFIAHNRLIDRKVAIKFYYWADDARGHIEPSTLAAVGSDSIVDVLDASAVGDEWAMFVTPYCEKGDLDRYRESHRFGLREALRFTSLLLGGVAVLHEQRFVHRDLKPENLLVSDSGNPLIADFGSVRLIPDGQTKVPGSGHSLAYRPPESFLSGEYDRRGDLYQCGIVLFQVLGGRLPYDSVAYLSTSERQKYAEIQDDFERHKLVEHAVQRRVCHSQLLNLNSLPFYVPKTVKRVIRRATACDPERRFQNASDFMNKLNDLAGTVIDWQYEGEIPVAVTTNAKFRISRKGSQFVAEQNKGSGWRKLPGATNGPCAEQLKQISARALR